MSVKIYVRYFLEQYKQQRKYYFSTMNQARNRRSNWSVTTLTKVVLSLIVVSNLLKNVVAFSVHPLSFSGNQHLCTETHKFRCGRANLQFKRNIVEPHFGRLAINRNKISMLSMSTSSKRVKVEEEEFSLVNREVSDRQIMGIRQSLLIFLSYFKKRTRNAFKKQIKEGSSEFSKAVLNGDYSEELGDDEMETYGILGSILKLNENRKKLISLVGFDGRLIWASLTSLTIGAFFQASLPHFYGSALSAAIGGSSSEAKVIRALIHLFIASALAALFTSCRGSLFWMAGARAKFSVRTKLHRNLLNQDASFFDETETGILMSRVNSDTVKIADVISFHVNIVLRQLAQFFFGASYLIITSPRLATLSFLGMGASYFISIVYGRFSRKLAGEVQVNFFWLSSILSVSKRFILGSTCGC
mmetsp:Transcript_43334/g.101649  ORF Transcript_43334/g.101649 Transcript_43334/m.101649 type:complete len:416 (+) Transcript_43334:399-1646(+)